MEISMADETQPQIVRSSYGSAPGLHYRQFTKARKRSLFREAFFR